LTPTTRCASTVRRTTEWQRDEIEQLVDVAAPAVIDSKCPTKIALFTRITGKRFQPADAKEVQVSSREECQARYYSCRLLGSISQFSSCSRCLAETSFQCRAASFDTLSLKCHLSRYTVRTNPSTAEDSDGFDYLENECLTGEIVISCAVFYRLYTTA
jgi:hypothetical protein